MSLSGQRRVNFDELWSGIAEAVKHILSMKQITASFLHEDIYKICIATPSHFEKLYLSLRQLLLDHVVSLRESMKSNDPTSLIKEYYRAWTAYIVGAACVHCLFSYLNKQWVEPKKKEAFKMFMTNISPPNSPAIYTVYELSLLVWKEEMYQVHKVRLFHAVLQEIENERSGASSMDQTMIRGVIESLSKLHSVFPKWRLYSEFEEEYLKKTNAFYQNESAHFLSTNGVPQYMLKAEKRIEEEHIRSNRYLEVVSVEKVRCLLYKVFVEHHQEAILREADGMLEESRTEDIRRCYRLLAKTSDGVTQLLDIVYKNVVNHGMRTLQSMSGPDPHKDVKQYVKHLLALQSHAMALLQDAFNGDSQFVAIMNKALRKILQVNHIAKAHPSFSADAVCQFTDLCLRKGAHRLDDEELDSTLLSISHLLNHIEDKDVFMKLYGKMLCRRMILSTTVSTDVEMAMISRMKTVCGFEYTRKLQQLFGDLTVSSDLTSQFKTYSTDKGKPTAVDLSICVVSAGAWPLPAPKDGMTYPEEILSIMQDFQEFYQLRYSGRRLQWDSRHSRADVRILPFTRKYEINVHMAPLAVLMHFNTQGEISWGELKTKTGLEAKELDRALKPLCACKLLLMNNTSDGDTTKGVISLNSDFNSKRLKFKVSMAAGEDGTSSRDHQTNAMIEEDRKLYIQAIIVRVMKSRIRLSHQLLVQEVIEHSRSRFSPNITLIKKCVEILLEKEYIERDPHENNHYIYIS